jgi:hypothetical protein
VVTYEAYRLRPSGNQLFHIFDGLCADKNLWSDRQGISNGFSLFDAAAESGDTEKSYHIGRKILADIENRSLQGVVRFVLAARILLVHRQLEVADKLILARGESQAHKAEAALDQFLFRMRCRVDDTLNPALFAAVLGSNSPFVGTAASEWARYRWRYEGPSHLLLSELRQIASRLGQQGQDLWLECLAVAFRLNDMDAVCSLLAAEPWLASAFNRVLPLAAFLEERPQSKRSPAPAQIRPYARLHREFLENNRLLEQRIRNPATKVAVIGNSPCELKSGKGPAIDAHDLVARFNYFSLDEAFSADYGKKFHIHVRGAGDAKELHERSLKADWVVMCQFDFLFQPRHWRNVLPLLERGMKLCCLPAGLHQPLQKALHAEPSLGLAFCAYVKNLRGTLPRTSCFGFSFVDQIGRAATSAHYFEQAAPALTHRWESEKTLFESLVD